MAINQYGIKERKVKKKSYAKPMPRKWGEKLKATPMPRKKRSGPTKATPMKYQDGGQMPQYDLGGWLKKKTKKARKGWDKHIKHGAITEGLRAFDKDKLGGRLSKAYSLPERYKGMSWKHIPKMKPMDILAATGSLGAAHLGPLGLLLGANPISSLAATKAQKMYGTEGLRGDTGPEDPGYVDPNLFGARQRFGGGSDISGLMKKLMGGASMQEGGEVPAGRRMYATGGYKKRRKQ